MRNSQEIISYIKNVRKKKKITLDSLATKVGIAKSTLSRYENGSREFPINDIHLYAEALGVSTFQILGLPESTSYESISIPFFGNVAAGALSVINPTFEENVEYIEVPYHLLGKYKDLENIFSMKVNGDSMDKLIPNGSIVIAKESNDYMENDIVIFKHDNEYSLKRFRPNDIDGGYLFKCESNDERFKDIFVSSDTDIDFKICAKVISYTVFC